MESIRAAQPLVGTAHDRSYREERPCPRLCPPYDSCARDQALLLLERSAPGSQPTTSSAKLPRRITAARASCASRSTRAESTPTRLPRHFLTLPAMNTAST